MLEAYHERLAGVVIERMPYQEFIPRYDRPGTLFYLDPPYYGSEHYYGRSAFVRDDFERLADLLRSLTGRFILSINDHPEVRRIFRGFTFHAVPVTYTVHGKGGAARRQELIITGG
jgi:DNA adenine methylase